jgi:hypothetical protein
MHSASLRHVAPGLPLAVQTVRQKASAVHSDENEQLVPTGFTSRQMREPSQYRLGLHWELRQPCPDAGNRSQTPLRHTPLGPQAIPPEKL